MAMLCFRWISARALPPGFDLRARNWRLCGDGSPEHGCARLIDVHSVDPFDLLPLASWHRSLVLGVADSRERARWLTRGYGDALACDVGLEELDLRCARLLGTRWGALRRHGRLELDPRQRDVLADGRFLRLHPREFALLWRLAEEPGELVPRADLLRDVLGLTIEPRTNALAVHVCRLRKKLHTVRLSHLLVTGSSGGSYALMPDAGAPPLFAWRNPLDDAGVSGEEMALIEEAAE